MAPKKILLVDDDPDVALGLGIRLRKAGGYNVVVASDGVGAVTRAQRERPDLIILDIGLPAGDGFSVLERLKTLTSTALVPVIVLTAKDPAFVRDRVLEMGADAFFQKPADNDAFLASVRQALGEPNPPAPPPPAGRA